MLNPRLVSLSVNPANNPSTSALLASTGSNGTFLNNVLNCVAYFRTLEGEKV
jgi:hypothetical protein